MSFFHGDYLRVLTPQTVDGINLMYENDKPVYSEQHLPLTARKFLEKENEKLPNQLKHKIELVETGFGATNTPQKTQTKAKA